MTKRNFNEWLSKFKTSISDYTYYVEGSKKTLKGEDLEACFWALNDLTYMLENSNHAYRVKSLEDYKMIYYFIITG